MLCKRRKGSGPEWKGRWRETWRSRRKGNHSHDILCGEKLFLIIEINKVKFNFLYNYVTNESIRCLPLDGTVSLFCSQMSLALAANRHWSENTVFPAPQRVMRPRPHLSLPRIMRPCWTGTALSFEVYSQGKKKKISFMLNFAQIACLWWSAIF